MSHESHAQKVAVIGNGWAAVAAVGLLARSGHEVAWIPHSAARMSAPLPSLENGPGVEVWRILARALEMDLGVPQTGTFIREFRNKAFREPQWAKAPTPEMRAEVRDESLWGPERRIAGVFEARFELTVGEIEEAIRARLAALPGIQKIEGNPVAGFAFDESSHRVQAVKMSSGEEIPCDRVIYADRWSELAGLEGLPKPLSFNRARDPMGMLQVQLTHQPKLAAGLIEGFFSPVYKDAGEEFQRHVFGYFSADGSKSFWTLFLAANEVEDNHEIAKKLRRMKQALGRMFSAPEFLPEGKADFASTIAHEQVIFAEAMMMAGGEAPEKPLTLPKAKGICFVTDGYGPSHALHQVALALPQELEGLRATYPLDEVSSQDGMSADSPERIHEPHARQTP